MLFSFGPAQEQTGAEAGCTHRQKDKEDSPHRFQELVRLAFGSGLGTEGEREIVSDQLAELLRQHLKDGTWDSSGVFTLDLARAASRLGQDFSTAHPGCYPLRLVQAGVAMECADLHFRTRGKKISLTLTKPRVKHVQEYFEFALQRSNKLNDSTPFFPLFQGLWAALREDARSVKIAVWENGKGASYLCSSDSVERLQDEKSHNAEPNGIELEFSLNRKAPGSLRSLVRARCSFCPVPIYWNGKKMESDTWALLSPEMERDWYLPWVPHGFRLAEAYITKAQSTVKASIAVPSCSARKPAFSGIGNAGRLPGKWKPQSYNTFYHKGNGEGLACGAVAQSMVGESTTDLLLVSLGVVLENSAKLIRQGGIAVLECSTHGIKTDIFGLRAVAGKNLDDAQAMAQKRIIDLRKEVKSYLLELPRRTGISDAQIWLGAALVLGTPFLGGLPSLGLGAFQIGCGLFQKKVTGSSFLAALESEFPDLARHSLSRRAKVEKTRYRIK